MIKPSVGRPDLEYRYHCFVSTWAYEERLVAAEAIVEPLNRLREHEVSIITIFHPNPDFDGPQEAIEIESPATRGKRMRFTGDTLAEALANAEATLKE